MQVDHLGIRILLQQVVTHSMHQVSLAEADATIEEQRVVTMLEVVRHLPGCGASQLVRFAFDEILEGEGAVEIAGVLERAFDLHVTLGANCRRSYRRQGRGCQWIDTRSGLVEVSDRLLHAQLHLRMHGRLNLFHRRRHNRHSRLCGRRGRLRCRLGVTLRYQRGSRGATAAAAY
ncbi:hypothetical protein D3C76_681690 [compost metagenome]